MSTFVSVGNATQPFTRLLDAVCALAERLPQPVFVQYGAASGFQCAACTGAAFLEMGEFAERVAAADLLILHAGAGSVLHAIRAGKTPVLVPRLSRLGEHVDDHQLEFARELEGTGKAVVAHDLAALAEAATLAMERQRSGSVSTGEPRLVGMMRELLARHAQAGGK